MSYKDPEYHKHYRLKNIDRLRAIGAAYYKANREKVKERQKKYVQENKEKIKKRKQIYCQVKKEDFARRAREVAAKIKMEMIVAYGGRCVCCEENRKEFLTIDHINGGGGEHRKRCSPGAGIYRDIKRQGWPKDKYRLLCMNCNFATRAGRTCPHAFEVKENVSSILQS